MISTTPSYTHSTELYEAACDVLPGGASSSFRLGGQPVPLFFERGEGARLHDVDGNVYLDYALGMGPNILGHGIGISPAQMQLQRMHSAPKSHATCRVKCTTAALAVWYVTYRPETWKAWSTAVLEVKQNFSAVRLGREVA